LKITVARIARRPRRAMSESLRDQLLKSGLVRTLRNDAAKKPARSGSERADRAVNRPQDRRPKQARSEPRNRSEIDLAKAYALRDSTERAERERAAREAEQRAREKKERRQRLAALLEGKARNAKDADIPRHFPHANKIRRIYVTAEQLPCLNGGELGVVQLAGRYLLVDRSIAEAARDIDGDSLVLLCDPHENAAEDDVPSDLVW
jgi:uncharacterized protein YaiL (DUF2058 family)